MLLSVVVGLLISVTGTAATCAAATVAARYGRQVPDRRSPWRAAGALQHPQ
jgi:hypothetical protein